MAILQFQRVSRLGSVTARHSSIGRQPNFASFNGRSENRRPPQTTADHHRTRRVTMHDAENNNATTLKPRLHDTTGCHTGCQTGLTAGLTTVLNEQYCSFNRLSTRGVQPVWQTRFDNRLYTWYSRLSKRFDNRFDNRLYCVSGALDRIESSP